MRKIITFLGTSPKDTIYEWQGKTYPGKVFAEALRMFVDFDKMLVLTTPEAAKKTWPLLADLQDARIQQVPIPDGKDIDDMWEIFRAVIAEVDQGETVIFDITHGFRSLPFLAFLFAAYLKTAKKVTIEAVYYGAFEMAAQNDNKAPVIDMSPFVNMLDWITATEGFVETGDGRALTHLLKLGMPTGLQMGQDLETRMMGKNLKLTADTIQTISLALQVTRPMEVMASAAHLSSVFEQTLPVISDNAPPFAVLASSVAQQYGQFGLENAEEPQNLKENLLRQLKMVQWYLEHEQIVHAATLMREWLVSLLAFKFDAPMFDYEHGRFEIEKALNNFVESLKGQPHIREKSRYDLSFTEMPERAEIAKLWNRMSKERNDIAHVGMRINPNTAAQLEQKVKAFLPQLERLAELFLH